MKIQSVLTLMNQGNRPSQEDFVVAYQDKGIFVVADGFGGPEPGALAAKTSCEEVKRFLYKEGGDQDATLPFVLRSYYSLAGNVIFNSLVHANRKLMKLNRGKGVHEKGGASVLAGFLDGDLLALANVGVCSAWMLRAGRAAELVMPRGYGRLSDPFDVFLEDAPIPLTALGISEDIEPEVFEYRVQAGDWLLMQSPGAGRAVRDRMLELQQNWLQASPSEDELQKSLDELRFQGNTSISLVIF